MVLIAAMGLLPAWGKAAEPPEDCPALKGATPQAMLSYLEKDRSTLNGRCILAAINRLGEIQYVPAIPTLIDYLDYKKLLPKNLPLQVDHPQPTNGLYPASVALEKFGKFAVPDVKKTIQDDSKSRVQRLVAAELYSVWLIEDHRAGIRFIVQSSKISKDPEASSDLLNFATKLAERCGSKQCYAALNGE